MSDTTQRQDRPTNSDSEPSPIGVGERVGPYVLLKSLGRGGLGEVWLAQRVSGEYTPDVAIKLLLGNRIGDSEVFRRFDRERRILARLDHPDIARLLDAGRFGQGWPYLVMEYVEGRRLDEAARDLDVPDRLRLFIRICQAVQFAHRRLVLHRDLKPSNILVTKDLQPRLLDFNTAKLLEADEDPDLTRVAAPMTRRYASPEQVREEPLTTASDIYSLGVVLYEVLVQDSPYGPDTTSAHALNQAICEQEGEPPSRLGIGDRSLDAIVACAMNKDPDRRYPSAAALADDIGAWLDRRPIKARSISRLERFGLMLKRHPVASSLTTGLSALVLGAMALFLWQLQEAREERDVALAVTEFLESLFDATDPGSTSFSGEDLFAVLDERGERLLESPPADPRIASRLMSSLGAVQANFGRTEAASSLFEAAWGKRADEEIMVRWANARLELGDVEGAARLFAQAHAARSSMSDAMQAFHGASYAQLKVIEGDVEQALKLAETAADAAPIGSVDEVFATDTLAQVFFHAGDWPQAVEVGRRALALAIDYYGDPHLQVATSRNNLALFLGRLGEDAEALELLERATEDFVTLLGADDPRLAVTYSNLGNRRSLQRRFDSANDAYGRSLRLTRLHYGEDHPWIGLILGYQGRNAQRMDELDTAAGLFRQALETLGDSPNHRGRVRLAWASNMILVGELEAAVEMLERARSDTETIHPEGHPRRLAIEELRALVHLEQGNVESAGKLISELRQTASPDSPGLGLLEARSAVETGDCAQARLAWSGVNQSTEMEKPALYRRTLEAITTSCSVPPEAVDPA